MSEVTSRVRPSFAPAIAGMWTIAVALAGIIIGMALFVGCGGDDATPTIELPDPTPSDTEQWFDVTDTQTGRHFRCIMWTKTNSSVHLGLTSFCYEPYKGAGE